ncbi:MAG TPA: thymidylate kinase [Terracidiphilus sp.]
MFVSFSGIDGAGKSTQIDALSSRLQKEGLRVRNIRFWDDVARLKGIRETSGHKIFKGDKGVGSPEAPIERRDKNVQSGFMTAVRLFLYSVDAISMRLAVRRALRSDADFIIFDRYTYDELANLNLRNPLVRLFIRVIMKIVPRPDVSYLLDADPLQARARKPEYPLEFLYTNRQRYMNLCALLGGITVIPPNPVPEVARQVFAHAMKHVWSAHETDAAISGNSGGPASLENPRQRPAAS